MNWKQFENEQPTNGSLVVIYSDIYETLSCGTYSNGYLTGRSLPDGYMGLSKKDKWIELPQIK